MSTKSHKIFGLSANEKAPRPPPTFKDGNYQINWVAAAVLFVPLIMVCGAFIAGVPFTFNTFLAMMGAFLFNGFGITVGYHRLFSHRAFSASYGLQAALAFAGSGAFQGSIKWWGRNHRIHHRYIDTDKDPYNATRGFFYTHMGWMLMKQDYDILGHVDINDFHYNKLVMWQHEFYFPMAILSGIVLPTVVCGLGWGDWMGGYFYAALLKVVLVHHSTFFINSLAHTNFGGAKQNFSTNHSSHDSFICALATMGEGYHNFHHEFAQDYRNGIEWYQYDPSKWLINLFAMLGLARGLVRTPKEVIERNVNNVQHKRHADAILRLEKRLKQMDVAVPNVWTWADVEERVAKGEKLTVIGDYVLDLKKAVPLGRGSEKLVWYDNHPGGRKMLDMFVGKDATDAFTGGIYKHHEGALNLLPYLRVASMKRE